MKIQDVASAAQSLANYLYREGEGSDMKVVAGQIKLLADRAAEIQRTREMVAKG